MVIVRRKDFIDNLENFRHVFPHKLGDAFSHFHILIRCISGKSVGLLGDIVDCGVGNR